MIDDDLETVLAHSTEWSPHGIDAAGLLGPHADAFTPLEPDEVKHCIRYLKRGIACGEIGLVTCIKKYQTSYGWKHLAENGLVHLPKEDKRYVSNGAFLAACWLLGISMKATDEESKNAYLALAWLPNRAHALWRPDGVSTDTWM